MLFKKFCAGTQTYGSNEDPPKEEVQLPNVSFHDPMLEQTLSGNGKETEALKRTLLFLSLCHTIVKDAKSGSYNAASPDELALVNFAK